MIETIARRLSDARGELAHRRADLESLAPPAIHIALKTTKKVPIARRDPIERTAQPPPSCHPNG